MYKHSPDADFLGASTRKERKQIENRKVVELGGKVIFFTSNLTWNISISQCIHSVQQAIKKHRTPLSVAKPAMKNQMKREQRKVEEVW